MKRLGLLFAAGLISCSGAEPLCSPIAFDPRVIVVPDDGVELVEFCVDTECRTNTLIVVGAVPASYSYAITVLINGDRESLTGTVETVMRPNVVGEPCLGESASVTMHIGVDGSVTEWTEPSP